MEECEIDGHLTQDELERALQLKEAAGNELVALDNNDDSNDPKTIATFEELDPGEQPTPLKLIKKTDAAPAGTTLVCSGTVFVSGQKSELSAVRPT